MGVCGDEIMSNRCRFAVRNHFGRDMNKFAITQPHQKITHIFICILYHNFTIIPAPTYGRNNKIRATTFNRITNRPPAPAPQIISPAEESRGLHSTHLDEIALLIGGFSSLLLLARPPWHGGLILLATRRVLVLCVNALLLVPPETPFAKRRRR